MTKTQRVVVVIGRGEASLASVHRGRERMFDSSGKNQPDDCHSQIIYWR